MIHNLTVKDRVVTYPFNDSAVQGNVGVDSLHVEFDSEWSQTTSKSAVFANGGSVVRLAMLGSDVSVPWEVLRDPGRLFVTFVGYVGTAKRIVTKVMERPFRVDPSGVIDGTDPSDPTPDEIQYLIDALNKATDAATKATKSANDAATSATSAATSADLATSAATSAASKADRSATGADASAKSATSAAERASGAAAFATDSAGKADDAAKSANDVASSASESSGKADAAASDAADAAIAATDAAGDAGRAATAATNAAKSATDASASADAAASKADAATGRANSAADEVAAYMENVTIGWSNLDEECRNRIAESAASGMSMATSDDLDLGWERVVEPSIYDTQTALSPSEVDWCVEYVLGKS